MSATKFIKLYIETLGGIQISEYGGQNRKVTGTFAIKAQYGGRKVTEMSVIEFFT